MGLSKEEQREKHRISGNVTFVPQPKIIKKVRQNTFNKKVKRTKSDLKIISKYDNKGKFDLLTQDTKTEKQPKTKKKDMVKYIRFGTIVNFGMYRGKTGRQILKINKRYLQWMRAENICKFCPQMHEILNK